MNQNNREKERKRGLERQEKKWELGDLFTYLDPIHVPTYLPTSLGGDEKMNIGVIRPLGNWLITTGHLDWQKSIIFTLLNGNGWMDGVADVCMYVGADGRDATLPS